MKPWIGLRAVSIAMFLFFLGHTAGTLIPQPSSGPAEDAAVGGMKTFHFDAMGWDRTLWDFWEGFGVSLSVFLLAFAVLAWQLASRSRNDPNPNPAGVRGLVATLGLSIAAISALCWKYFFILPACFSLIAAVFALIVWISLRRVREA